MKKLLIYIPTFNRLAKLKLCVARLMAELQGHEAYIAVHISDNCSTDGTAAYLESIDHPCFSHSCNESNIGLPGNVLKVHGLAEIGEFTWVIGDDDLVLCGSIAAILEEIDNHSDVDLFFLNTIVFPERDKDIVLPTLVERDYAFDSSLGGVRKSYIDQSFTTTMKNLIDPKIDEVFMGSLMCYSWRSAKVSNRIHPDELSQDFSKPKACYHVVLNYLYNFSPTTKCRHLHRYFTLGFWHGGDAWESDGITMAVTHGLGIIFYEAARLGYIDEQKQAKYFQHYMNIAENGYRVILQRGSKDFFQHYRHFHPYLAEMCLRYGCKGVFSETEPLHRIRKLSTTELIKMLLVRILMPFKNTLLGKIR